jgi:ABC-type transporter Mla MlaB component
MSCGRSVSPRAGVCTSRPGEEVRQLVAPDHSARPARRASRRPSPSSGVDLVLRAPLDGAALDDLCERVRALVRAGVDPVVCDASGLTGLDLAAVVVLARLQLTARRSGGRIRVRSAGSELHDILWLSGLCDVVGPCTPLLLEAGGQTEEREEPRGVEEERDAGDPIA